MAEFWWSTSSEEMLLLPKDVVFEHYAERQALACRTWGDLKKLDFVRYVDFLYKSGTLEQGDEALDNLHFAVEHGEATMNELRVLVAAAQDQLPKDGDHFDQQSTGAFEDGDWPLHAAQLMDEYVPSEIAIAFGSSTTSVFNGDFLYIPADKQEEVLAVMAKLGHICTEDHTIWSLTETF